MKIIKTDGVCYFCSDRNWTSYKGRLKEGLRKTADSETHVSSYTNQIKEQSGMSSACWLFMLYMKSNLDLGKNDILSIDGFGLTAWMRNEGFPARCKEKARGRRGANPKDVKGFDLGFVGFGVQGSCSNCIDEADGYSKLFCCIFPKPLSSHFALRKWI